MAHDRTLRGPDTVFRNVSRNVAQASACAWRTRFERSKVVRPTPHICNCACDVVRRRATRSRRALASGREPDGTHALCEVCLRNEYCEACLRKDPLLKVRARHLWNDTLATVGVLVFVLAVLISVDERVREQTSMILSPGAVTSIPAHLGEVGSALVEAARTQSLEHAPLMSFIVVATVLLLGMMRK